eukprot:CAMPEP_0172328258 /NCGR_PEP_ID=MMETSP1058-20130122/60260_1 /TAXON_ID=83371 /ORGANISM="Detonula confervacea, Strain CCMP 353" /LENGTH=512 /DNA_ID=CAMNT_0013045365 /DNA_START=263 /DNA_END=1802 /DNA_ORIENTATION=-
MLIRLIISAAIAFYPCYADGSSGGSNHPDVSDVLIEWLRANGTYINEKLEVKRLVPNDPLSPRGVFATEDMDAGETLCSIPSKLIVKSRKELMEGIRPANTHCGTIKAVMEAMSGDDITPYGQYLLHQPKGYLPAFWSEAGRDLLAEMLKSTRSEQLTEYDELPPHGVQESLDDLKEDCDGDVDDPFYLQAAMLVNARADYEYMIPFYDMFNHHNGKYNMNHKFDPYKGKDPIENTPDYVEYDELPPHGIQESFDDLKHDCNGDVDDPFYLQAAMLVNARADYEYMIPFYDMFNHHNGKYNMKHKYDHYKGKDTIENTGAGFVTTKSIKAGDELYNSYNRCNICQEYYDWQGTPEMLLQFGFVETLPQRWLFDFARVKFELDWKDDDETTGEVVVDFLVPPSEKGMLLLQEELTRLKSFSTMHRRKSYKEYEGMSKYEWESLWQYYDALHDALTNAIVQSDATLSDEVWELGDNWWVKDGSLNASQEDEHYVLPTDNYVHPTQSHETLNDEL